MNNNILSVLFVVISLTFSSMHGLSAANDMAIEQLSRDSQTMNSIVSVNAEIQQDTINSQILANSEGGNKIAPDTTFSKHIRIDKSSFPDSYTMTARGLVTPLTLLTLGVVGLSHPEIRVVRENLRDAFADFRQNRYFTYDDYLQYAPTFFYLGAKWLGAIPKYRFVERFGTALWSFTAAGICVNAIKYSVGDLRPDGSARNSFPSGHTTVAFLGAELMRIEYGNALGIPAYIVATGVGILRMYNNKHWINDVFAGAGLGILCARFGYWMMPYTQKIIKRLTNNTATDLSIAPNVSSICLLGYQNIYHNRFGRPNFWSSTNNIGIIMTMIF